MVELFLALTALVADVAATAGAPAPAAIPEAPPPATAAEKQKDVVVTGERPKSQKRVCKRSVATGSIMPTVTCRTVAEWEEVRERSVANLERMKNDQKTRQYVKDAVENR